jgi:hypothetical protein
LHGRKPSFWICWVVVYKPQCREHLLSSLGLALWMQQPCPGTKVDPYNSTENGLR